MSLIRKSILPPTYKTAGIVMFQTPAARIVRRPCILVDVQLGTRQFTIRCGAIEDSIISVPLLIGHNVPNLKMLQLTAETAPPEQELDMDEFEKRKKKTTSKREAEQQKPQVQSGGGEPPEETAPTQEETRPAEVNRLQLVHVITRAAKARQLQNEQEDDEAIQQSQVEITPWDDSELFPEEGGTDMEESQQPHDSITPSNPQDRQQLAQAQKEDTTLEELFKQAREKDSNYRIKKGVLYKASVDQLGEPMLLLVVPTDLR